METVSCSNAVFCQQVEVKEVSERWKGYVKIGVSSLPPETVCGWNRWTAKSDTSGKTIVLDGTEDGRLCVWCKGEVSHCMHTARISGCVLTLLVLWLSHDHLQQLAAAVFTLLIWDP